AYIMSTVDAPLVFFMPVVSGMGGNIGPQSASVAVITLSNKDVNFSKVGREGIVGIITGLLGSIITCIVIYFVMRKVDLVLNVS
ncbi:magnesium transporter, partial [Clostridioides difficile]